MKTTESDCTLTGLPQTPGMNGNAGTLVLPEILEDTSPGILSAICGNYRN